jgi:trehalose 6-phosphate phosphatase
MPTDPARLGRRRLMDHCSAILRKARAAPAVVLFLDFDGTLTPLRRRAEDVRLAPAARALLRRLARHRRLAIFIVSGRRLADLKRHIRLARVRCLGVHGWEGLPGARMDPASRRALHRALAAAGRHLLPIPGIRLENKRMAFAVHYRGARAAAVRRARRRLLNLLRPFHRELRLMDGHKVWEVLPRDHRGKGAAVQKLLESFPPGSLPICIGDDTTDETAFEALPHGVTVRVGKARRTKAGWRARNPADVLRFLKVLESELG